MTSPKKVFFSILSGAFLALPFFEHCPPFYGWIWPFIGLFLLLKIFENTSAKGAFFYGWLMGFVFFGLGVSWVYISIHDFGEVPVMESGLITVAFALFLGLFFALYGYFLNRFFSPKTWSYALLAFPALGLGMELLKSVIFTGFPWLEIGVTQLYSPLSGWIPVIGSYGAGGWMLLMIGIVNHFTLLKTKRFWLSFLALLPLLGGQYLKTLTWTTPVQSPLTVSLVQGNISQSLKWDEDNIVLSLKTYAELTAALPPTNLIVWPETAVPLNQIDAAPYLDQLNQQINEKNGHTTLVTGIPLYDASTEKYFNAALTLGQGQGRYLKQHLVPFGEYIPLHVLFGPIFQFLHIPMSDFAEGKSHQKLIQSGSFRLSTFICYESAYSELVRNSAKNSNLILVLSDDAWFGDSAGPYQHLQINQIRALENGRYVLSASNDGITAVINSKGEVVKKIPRFERTSLTTTALPLTGQTPFERLGIWPVFIFILFALALAKKRNPQSTGK